MFSTNSKKLIVQFVLSIVAIAAVAYVVQIDKVIEVLSHARLEYFFAAVVCYFAINFLMTYRITVLLSGMGADVKYIDALKSHFAGMLASDFTPARSGYFACAFVLAKRGATTGQAIAAILGPQLFDFSVKVIAGALGIYFIINNFELGDLSLIGSAASIFAVFVMLLFAFLLMFSSRFLLFLKPIFSLTSFSKKFFALFSSMQKHSGVVKNKLGFILGLLACTWMIKGLEWMLLGEALSIKPEFAYGAFVFYLILQPLVTALQFVPFPTLAGAGLSEAGTIGIMFLFGVSAPQAAAYALLARGFTFAIDLLGAPYLSHVSIDSITDEKEF